MLKLFVAMDAGVINNAVAAVTFCLFLLHVLPLVLQFHFVDVVVVGTIMRSVSLRKELNGDMVFMLLIDKEVYEDA